MRMWSAGSRRPERSTSTADYQINKLLILGNSTEFIEQEIKQLSQKSDPELWELYDKVSNWEYVRYKDAYQQIKRTFCSVGREPTDPPVGECGDQTDERGHQEHYAVTWIYGGYGRWKKSIYTVIPLLSKVS